MPANRPCRILHVVGAMNRGGVETWLMDVLRHIDRSRFHFDFLVNSSEPGVYDSEIAALGGLVIPCLAPSEPLNYARAFRRIVQSHTPYDIVHSHVYLFSGFVLALARLEGISTRIAHIHPTQDWAGRERPSLARPIYRWLMVNSINANAVHLLFASHQAQAAFARLGGRQAPNSRVLYCGIDFAKFAEHSSRQATRQELGIPDNAKVVLTVGRFVPHKNHRHLVEIARQVRAVRDDVIFLLVGTGPLLSEIQNLVSERGLSACFRFVPSLEEIASVYRAADLFLFPSLMEGFGRVVVEAAASGLPIVASDIPGIDESSRASAYPALIEPQNTAGFSSAVLEGLKQPRARFSPDAERLEPLSLSTSIKNLVNVYDPTGDMR